MRDFFRAPFAIWIVYCWLNSSHFSIHSFQWWQICCSHNVSILLAWLLVRLKLLVVIKTTVSAIVSLSYYILVCIYVQHLISSVLFLVIQFNPKFQLIEGSRLKSRVWDRGYALLKSPMLAQNNHPLLLGLQ